MNESIRAATRVVAPGEQHPGDGDLTTVMERILAGDREAFEVIIDRYRGLLIAVAYNYTCNFDTAQDLAQIALVRCYFEIQKRGRLKVKPWLMKVIKHLCIDWKRLARRRTLSLDEIKEAGWEPAAGKPWNPETAAMRNEQQERIQRAFDALPEEQRRALVLKYVEDLSYDHITRIMNISLAKLKSLLYRARIAFRRQFQEQEGEM